MNTSGFWLKDLEGYIQEKKGELKIEKGLSKLQPNFNSAQYLIGLK